jgi:nitrite reductase (NADH) small subunit
MTGERSARVHRAAFESKRSVPVRLNGHRIVVTLTESGPFAYADRCPHRGAPLLMGGRIVTPLVKRADALVLGESASHVRCPWHKWDYDLRTGRCAVDSRLRLRTYAAWIDGDEVVVSMERGK